MHESIKRPEVLGCPKLSIHSVGLSVVYCPGRDFLTTNAMQVSKIIPLLSRRKIASQLHGVLAKFADRRIVRIFRVQFFRRCCIVIARLAANRNLYVGRQCDNFLKLHSHHEKNGTCSRGIWVGENIWGLIFLCS